MQRSSAPIFCAIVGKALCKARVGGIAYTYNACNELRGAACGGYLSLERVRRQPLHQPVQSRLPRANWGGERSLSKAHVRGREPAPTQTTLHEEYRSTCGSTLIGAGARLASSAP